MAVKGRHGVEEYVVEDNFLVRGVMDALVGRAALLWSETNLSKGLVAVAGVDAKGEASVTFLEVTGFIQGQDDGKVLGRDSTRFMTPFPDDGVLKGHVTGRRKVGSVSLSSPVRLPPTRQGDPLHFAHEAAAGLAYGYDMVWCHAGSTWPVGLLHRKLRDSDHWLFVQFPVRAREVGIEVDLDLRTDQILHQIHVQTSAPTRHVR